MVSTTNQKIGSGVVDAAPPPTIVGRINSITIRQREDGRNFAVVSLRQSSGLPTVDIVVRDLKILRKFGIGDGISIGLPPHGRLARFMVYPDADGTLVASAMDVPERPLSSATELRADGRGIVPAIARVSARISVARCVGQARALAGSSRSARMSVDKIDEALRNYVNVRERKLGADTERDAMMRLLRAVIAGTKSAAHAESVPGSRRARQMASLIAEAQYTLTALRSSVIEAHADNVRVIRGSRAVGALLPKDPASRRQIAATVAWAAYQTICKENTDGQYNDVVDAMKACIVRSHSSGADARCEIEQALRHSVRALDAIAANVKHVQIYAEQVAVARSNVETALAWIGADLNYRDPVEEIKRLSPSAPEEAMLSVINGQRGAGNAFLEVHGTSGGGVAASFAGGETAIMHPDGTVRLVDARGRLVLLQIPNQPPRHFVDGVPVDDVSMMDVLSDDIEFEAFAYR